MSLPPLPWPAPGTLGVTRRGDQVLLMQTDRGGEQREAIALHVREAHKFALMILAEVRAADEGLPPLPVATRPDPQRFISCARP